MDISRELTVTEKEELNKLFTVKKLKKNEVVEQKNYNKVTISILSGVLRKFTVKDGKEKTLDLYFSNDLIVTPNFNYQPIRSVTIDR